MDSLFQQLQLSPEQKSQVYAQMSQMTPEQQMQYSQQLLQQQQMQNGQGYQQGFSPLQSTPVHQSPMTGGILQYPEAQEYFSTLHPEQQAQFYQLSEPEQSHLITMYQQQKQSNSPPVPHTPSVPANIVPQRNENQMFPASSTVYDFHPPVIVGGDSIQYTIDINEVTQGVQLMQGVVSNDMATRNQASETLNQLEKSDVVHTAKILVDVLLVSTDICPDPNDKVTAAIFLKNVIGRARHRVCPVFPFQYLQSRIIDIISTGQVNHPGLNNALNLLMSALIRGDMLFQPQFPLECLKSIIAHTLGHNPIVQTSMMQLIRYLFEDLLRDEGASRKFEVATRDQLIMALKPLADSLNLQQIPQHAEEAVLSFLATMRAYLNAWDVHVEISTCEVLKVAFSICINIIRAYNTHSVHIIEAAVDTLSASIKPVYTGLGDILEPFAAMSVACLSQATSDATDNALTSVVEAWIQLGEAELEAQQKGLQHANYFRTFVINNPTLFNCFVDLSKTTDLSDPEIDFDMEYDLHTASLALMNVTSKLIGDEFASWVLTYAGQNYSSPDDTCREVAAMLLCAMAQGCTEEFAMNHLPHCLNLGVNLLGDTNPVVQEAGAYLLATITTFHPRVAALHSGMEVEFGRTADNVEVVTKVIAMMRESHNSMHTRVIRQLCAFLNAFFEKCMGNVNGSVKCSATQLKHFGQTITILMRDNSQLLVNDLYEHLCDTLYYLGFHAPVTHENCLVLLELQQELIIVLQNVYDIGTELTEWVPKMFARLVGTMWGYLNTVANAAKQMQNQQLFSEQFTVSSNAFEWMMKFLGNLQAANLPYNHRSFEETALYGRIFYVNFQEHFGLEHVKAFLSTYYNFTFCPSYNMDVRHEAAKTLTIVVRGMTEHAQVFWDIYRDDLISKFSTMNPESDYDLYGDMVAIVAAGMETGFIEIGQSSPGWMAILEACVDMVDVYCKVRILDTFVSKNYEVLFREIINGLEVCSSMIDSPTNYELVQMLLVNNHIIEELGPILVDLWQRHEIHEDDEFISQSFELAKNFVMYAPQTYGLEALPCRKIAYDIGMKRPATQESVSAFISVLDRVEQQKKMQQMQAVNAQGFASPVVMGH